MLLEFGDKVEIRNGQDNSEYLVTSFNDPSMDEIPLLQRRNGLERTIWVKRGDILRVVPT